MLSLGAALLLWGEALSPKKDDLICEGVSSDIHESFRFSESRFTKENYLHSRKMLMKDIPSWIRSRAESFKKFPEDTADQDIFFGEIGMAYANHNTIVHGYVLKLEYQAASAETKEKAKTEFCNFLSSTPIVD